MHRVGPARVRVGTVTDVIDEVPARATAANRVVIAWSSYEKSVAIRVAAQHSSKLESAFVDGKVLGQAQEAQRIPTARFRVRRLPEGIVLRIT